MKKVMTVLSLVVLTSAAFGSEVPNGSKFECGYAIGIATMKLAALQSKPLDSEIRGLSTAVPYYYFLSQSAAEMTDPAQKKEVEELLKIKWEPVVKGFKKIKSMSSQWAEVVERACDFKIK